jgi:flagellar basal body-associated protein FliL
VAEDKHKEAEGKDGGGAAKKRLPVVVWVAVGAMLGGAGMVVAVPPAKSEVVVEKPPPADIDVQHPDLMEHQFNPRTQAGKSYASAGFYFVYRVREDREQEAHAAIKANWDRARSNVLLLLRSRTVADLNADNGQLALSKDLIDELDASLFPGRDEDKVARVTEILWSKWILQ